VHLGSRIDRCCEVQQSPAVEAGLSSAHYKREGQECRGGGTASATTARRRTLQNGDRSSRQPCNWGSDFDLYVGSPLSTSWRGKGDGGVLDSATQCLEQIKDKPAPV
jgi:hypothetical protein